MSNEDDSSEGEGDESPTEHEVRGVPPRFLKVKGHTAQNSKNPDATDYSEEEVEQLYAQQGSEDDE